MLQFGQANVGPWDFDQETLEVYRRFARLHMSLVPYLLSAARDAATLGRPILCPMALCAQRGTAGRTPPNPELQWQYFLGRSLLVAPVVTESHDKKVRANPRPPLVSHTSHQPTGRRSSRH